jgi:cytidyltransferase-like protein
MVDTERAPGNLASPSSRVLVSTDLDDLRSPQVRFLQEAARLGPVHVLLPSDASIAARTGRPPGFPEAERLFLAQSLRYVDGATLVDRPLPEAVPDLASDFATLVVPEAEAELRAACVAHGLGYRVIEPRDLAGFPVDDANGAIGASGARRVVVTGCFDWLHSGHVKFFMDAAALGDLYVVVGSDANVRLLKGEGHPLHSQAERQYMAQAVRYVHRTLISSGRGWMDAEPEIDLIRPHAYVVNEDGDKPAKREFCQAHGLEYVVLQRKPHADLPRRTSTDLRGF